jgi:hypothetical protein
MISSFNIPHTSTLGISAMKIKTSEATPLQLNWLVAECEGREILSLLGGGILVNGRYESGDEIPTELGFNYMWHPSTDWSQGGPIVDREKISINYLNSTDHLWSASIYEPVPPPYNAPQVKHNGSGTTALIAAMRCYVASRYGNEAEIPYKLL